MLRILHSELQSNIGGIESFLLNLSRYINTKNVQFDMLMNGQNQYLEQELSSLGVNVYHVPLGIISYVKYVKKLLKHGNYNFVHIHKNSAADPILPYIVKKYSDAKLIIHSHNTKPSSGSSLGVILHNFNKNRLNKLSDYNLACSDMAAKWMFNKNCKNIHIVKNGISVQNYVFDLNIRREYRKKLGLNGMFVITNVGAFRKQKNHEFLLDLFTQLNIPNKRLMLVGDGELKKAIEEKAKSLGIQDKVLFLGSRNDIANLLQASDVFVMPSLWEGLGIAAIEAQTNGLKVFVSTEFPKDCKVTSNVKFLSLNNKDSWVKEIEKKINNKVNRENVAEDIRKADYDMQVTAKKLEKIYEEKIESDAFCIGNRK